MSEEDRTFLAVRFSVYGKPVPQGSMRAIGSKVFHDKSEGLVYWRELVGYAAKEAMRGMEPTGLPVMISLGFQLRKPKTVKRDLPSVKPDLDKLVRAVLDSLTGVTYIDDAQAVCINAYKGYASSLQDEGVSISVERFWGLK